MARPDRPRAAPTLLCPLLRRCSVGWTPPGGDQSAQALLRAPVGVQALPLGRDDSLGRRLPWPRRRSGGFPRNRSALASTPHLLLLLLLAFSPLGRSPRGRLSWEHLAG